MSESYLEDFNLLPHQFEATEAELTEDQLLDSLFDIRCIKSETGWQSPLPMNHQRKLKEESVEPALPQSAFNSVRNVQKIKTFAVNINTETAMPTIMCPEIPPGESLLRRANPNLGARFKQQTPFTPLSVRPAAGESNATRFQEQNKHKTNDHCYTRDEEVDALETRSDSEEDIDVVSFDCDIAHGAPLSKTVFKKKSQQISPTVGYAYKNVAKTNLTTQNSYSATTYANDSTAAPTSAEASAIAMLGAENENTPATKKNRFKSSALCTPSNKDRSVLRLNPSDYLNKRTLHNNMERQRRVSLGVMFSALKETVPSCKNKDRAPKVLILREASKYATFLSKTINDSQKVKERLQAHIQERIDVLRELELEFSKTNQ